MTYLIDTNVFIDAKNRFYGFDICPAFWDWLVLKNKEGVLFSIEKVRDEINKEEDQLFKWIKTEGKR